jgi:glutamyl-tRNA synthetase
VLRGIEPFTPPVLEEALRSFCEHKGVKSGDMIHALRVSTTGVTVGPGIFECLAILGKAEVLQRIAQALSLKPQDAAASPS